MPDEMTPRDKRALALLAKYGSAVVVQYRGYWLSGGHRIAQLTIRRLLKSGFLETNGVSRVGITREGIAHSDPVDLPGGPPEEDDGPDELPLVQVEEEEVWTPPDVRDDADNPVEVDRFFQEEDREW